MRVHVRDERDADARRLDDVDDRVEAGKAGGELCYGYNVVTWNTFRQLNASEFYGVR